ncbi:unnamed protein product [Urochloa humidicola]
MQQEPLTTPCAHNFCKTCLLGAYDTQSSMRERSCGGRTLRAQKIVKKCPSCPTDICDFLVNPQINREMMDLIESLQQNAVEEGGDDANKFGDDSDSEENGGGLAKEEEDDGSLNMGEQDSAEAKKIECQIDDSDGNASGIVKTVNEIKGDQEPKKHKEEAKEEGKDAMKNTMSAIELVDALVEEDAVKEIKKGSKDLDNNESQQPQKCKVDDADIGTDDTKRMKTSASMDETAVCGSTVQHIRKDGEADV